MIARKNINRQLESLRNNLSTRVSDESYNVLLTRTVRIHASYLFHPAGQRVLQDICSTISSTGANSQINGWKDLASYLGLSFHQIGCIENYRYIDSTELVLMAFAQGENASLSEVLNNLLHIQRPDAVTKAQISITKMVDAVFILHNQNSHECTQNNEITRCGEFLLRPNNYSRIKQELPITLRELSVTEMPTPVVVKSPQPIIVPSIQSVALCQRSAPKPQSNSNLLNTNIKQPSRKMRTVMLTFADDGKEVALRIAQRLRENRSESFPVGVLILDEQEKFVSANPELFIMRCFSQTDYVVPIITPDYLRMVNSGPSVLSQSALSSWDNRYVSFIHDLMMKYYIDNQCRNSKIRCIVPQSHGGKLVFNSNILRNDPTLRVWINEEEVDNFVSRISIKKP